MNKFFTIGFFLLFLSCAGTKKIKNNQAQKALTTVANSHFGEKYASKQNDAQTHTLVFKKYKKMEDLFADVRFFIYDNEKGVIIFEDTLRQGTVKWHTAIEIIVISFEDPEKVGEGRQKNTYFYNVMTQQKMVKSK